MNTNTGNSLTFKVKKEKESNIFFVSVLTGPDMYSYIGTVTDGIYKHGKKSKITADAQSVRVFQYVLTKLLANSLPAFIEIWHEGKLVLFE